VVCIAVTTFYCFDCKDIHVIHKPEGPVSVIKNIFSPLKNETTALLETKNLLITNDNKIVIPQNKTRALQKNITFSIARKNEAGVEVVEHLKPKARQIPVDVLVASSSTVMDNNMNADQSYYQSPLMVYPFPMMNTYYPRYFPYTYPGYQGYPFFG